MGLLAIADFHSFSDLLKHQVKQMYDAEQQLLETLPKMASTAVGATLKDAFDRHLNQTIVHVERLEKVFGMLGITPERETSQAMKGLIAEGSEVLQAKGNTLVRDAALITVAQRVEHYEIAAYGSLIMMSRKLLSGAASNLLEATLSEEIAADQTLAQLAIGSLEEAA
jgi:ferritin-like metal-binding protein YciE